MKEQKQDMKLSKLDDLFTTQEERDYAVAEKVQEIDISKISNFPDHPFKVNDDEKMQDMVKSIKDNVKFFNKYYINLLTIFIPSNTMHKTN